MPRPLFLVGFMAAGKTTVGRLLAQATHRRFIDLDDVIAEQGESVAALVARDEAEFRRREAAALAHVIADSTDTPIIATGGGCAAYGDNMTRMRAAGLVVALDVHIDTAQARAAGGPPRPLLASAAELAAKRAPAYRRAHAIVDTTHRSLLEVVAQVAEVERAWQRLPFAHRDATLLALDERTYPVVVHERAIDGELIRTFLEGASRVVIITDHEVGRYWQTSAIAALSGAPDVLSIEPGERSKSLAVYSQICEALVAGGLDRGSVLVALGGGVVGDLTGFIAATMFRGIPVIQLPTTLVAMTDAAIGGKTAVDLDAGKNLVGAFWQPRLVACGLETLSTLPARERRAGFGELWKYALLDGETLWQLVDTCAPWAAGETTDPPPALRDVIQRSIAYKAAIVGRDEREVTGQRALLNLGHTVGHAIESATGLHHGEAVGLGLIAAARVSAAVVGARKSLEGEVTAALRRTGLPAELDPLLTDDVLNRIKVDKKRIGDKVRFIAIREVGACDPVEITVTELRRILRPDSAP
ncbi:MAG TPA: 3-dehydroquinate synthase [Kofleriaceae bacterium]|nr:3-dehydroquinate synthase [Kofleriaceae bacterium]